MYKFEISSETLSGLKRKILKQAKFIKEAEDAEKSLDPLEYYEQSDQQSNISPSANDVPSTVSANNGPTAPFTPKPRFEDLPKEEAKFSNDEKTTLDSKGFPWDERIHASSKALTKDGSWRYKRGVDEETIKKVEAELKGSVGQEVPQASSFQPKPTNAFNNEKEVEASEAPNSLLNRAASTSQASAPQIQSAPQATAPQSVGLTHSYTSFKQNLIPVFDELLKQGKIDQAYIDQLKAHFQVKELWNLLANENTCRDLYDTFIQHGILIPAEYE